MLIVMYVPEELKLNKFRLVIIPTIRDTFARIGQRVAPSSDYTGDDNPVFYGNTKVENMARSSAELMEATKDMTD